MKCPDESALLRAQLGELTVNDARALAAHCAGCSRCRQRQVELDGMLVDLSARPPLGSSEDAFTARVMAGRNARGADVARPARYRTRWPVVASVTSVASAAALAAALGLAIVRPSVGPVPAPAVAAHYNARGVQAADARALAELLFVREGVARPLSSATLHAGDALAVRATNTGDDSVHLLVFALDAAGVVHWVYPAYVKPESDPESVVIEAHVRDRLLDEVVEPESPALGAFRVFAVLSREPIKVSAVEAQRAEFARASQPSVLRGAHVQEWRVSWQSN